MFKIIWTNKLLKKYQTPTVLKERLLRPFFLRISLNNPVLDLGCGTGYFSELLANKKYKVLAVDNYKLRNPKGFDFIQNDICEFKSRVKFKTILLINTLTTLSKEKIELLFENINYLLSKHGKIYIVIMNSDIYSNKKQPKNLKYKKLSRNAVWLKFKLINGKYIEFNDNIITDNQMKVYSKKFGYEILKIKNFIEPETKKSIYRLYLLKKK